MPFVFSEEEIDQLATAISARIIPNLIDAMKKKITNKVKAMPPNLMSVDELAGRLNTNRKWIYRKVKENTLPGKKVGKFIMFERDEIERILAEGRMF